MAHSKETKSLLKTLPLGEHRLVDIIAIIIDCDQYQKEGLFDNSPYGKTKNKPFNDEFYEDDITSRIRKYMPKGLEDVWVDITYQRVLKLDVILKHLKRRAMNRIDLLHFNKMLAGSLDIAVRPNGRCFVWDGFRRSILAMLNGVRYVNASIVEHKKSTSTVDCRAIEAFVFKIKNGTAENMAKEELYKSGIVYKEPESIRLFNLIVEMGVDVLGTNPGHPELGAFSEFKDTVEKTKLDNDDFLVESSFKMQAAWPSDTTLTGYVVCGLAKFLESLKKTDEDDNEILSFSSNIHTAHPNSDDTCEVEKKLVRFAKYSKQTVLCANRLAGKSVESVAFNIGKKVMKLNRQHQYELADLLGFEVEEQDTLNFMGLAGTTTTVA